VSLSQVMKFNFQPAIVTQKNS